MACSEARSQCELHSKTQPQIYKNPTKIQNYVSILLKSVLNTISGMMVDCSKYTGVPNK